MSLQTAVLRQYKETFPQDKLKEISARTGIQITRVFRIINGSEMKLKEYEAFEACIENDFATSDFLKTAKLCLLKLNHERKRQLLNQMKHALKINFLTEVLSPSVELNSYA